MIKVTTRGSFKNIDTFLDRMKRRVQYAGLEKYGPIGVQALSAATPTESGTTAQDWYFEVVDRPGYYAIHWLNSNMPEGVSIAAILQYGHATRTGGYVHGVDYINPALQPVFQQIADDMWKEVTK